MGLLYEGTTATRDTVLGPGVALVSLDVTFHEDGVAGVGLGRTPTETPAWAYTIAHGVAVRAGQTRTFAAFGPARAASAFTRHVRVMGVDATVEDIGANYAAISDLSAVKPRNMLQLR